MNEDLKHLKEKKDFGYGDAIRITGAALALMIQIYYKRIAEDNILCVRFVFCLYAEDAGVFPHHGQFRDYLSGYSPRHMRNAIIDLFQTLDTEIKNRSSYLLDELKDFPYVNGGLFADE